MLVKYDKQYLSNFKRIAGCDEAGRGPLAGPVVVAACIMPLEDNKIIEGINDSKKLTAKKREFLFDKIIETALSYKIVEIDNTIIDEINILNATKKGMEEAINSLNSPDFCLIDSVQGLNLKCDSFSLNHGDATSYNIAAASILAKVHRDRLMEELHEKYPLYNFKKHKGYGTKEHIELLKKHGKCEIHRDTFIKNFVEVSKK